MMTRVESNAVRTPPIAAPAVSVIVVSYNTRELTREALRSLLEQTRREPTEVLVVDNASSDGSAEMIRAEFPGLTLMALDKNIGFAAANNLAAERAGGEYLLLLNPDTVVLDRAVERLLEFARSRPEAGIWGGRTLFADRTLNPTSCWARQTPWSLFCRASGLSTVFKGSGVFDSEGYGGWKRDSQREVDIVTGCFFLIRREMWTRLGGFDPAFFMYGEEADLCLRARKLGVRPMVTPDATIVHYGGASEKVREDKLVRLLRAKAMLIRRHWPAWQVGYGVLMLELWSFSRGLGARVLSFNKKYRESGAAWRGAWRRRAEWAQGGAPCTT
jgi:GT2 family glycosyltransferase